MGKKTYTEEYIAAIADAIRSVTGSTDKYKVGEMAGAISEIIQGATDVWIGTQFAYNALIETDINTCYIIFESNKILRVYAGSIIIYDVPVVWDYTLSNEVMTSGRTIDSNIQIQPATEEGAIALGWEYYLKAVFPSSLYSVGVMTFVNGLVFIPRYEGSIHRFNMVTARGQGIDGISWQNMPEAVEGEDIKCRLHVTKNINDSIYVYWINDDNSETFIGSNVAFGNDERASNIIFSDIGNLNYMIEEFKYRAKDD